MGKLSSLRQVVSGGQTGVDQASLRAALASGLSIGGWCPPGRISESGSIPDEFTLIETPRERSELAPQVPRSLRTEWNVRDSDATLIIYPSGVSSLDPGTAFTMTSALHYKKPVLICDPSDPRSAEKIMSWLAKFDVKKLNVAGASESKVPGIGDATYNLLKLVFGLLPSRVTEAIALNYSVDQD
ncbi:MAG: putative molybdenum carrier protein [Cyanobacteria bacterium P01_F01_bin.143]